MYSRYPITPGHPTASSTGKCWRWVPAALCGALQKLQDDEGDNRAAGNTRSAQRRLGDNTDGYHISRGTIIDAATGYPAAPSAALGDPHHRKTRAATSRGRDPPGRTTPDVVQKNVHGRTAAEESSGRRRAHQASLIPALSRLQTSETRSSQARSSQPEQLPPIFSVFWDDVRGFEKAWQVIYPPSNDDQFPSGRDASNLPSDRVDARDTCLQSSPGSTEDTSPILTKILKVTTTLDFNYIAYFLLTFRTFIKPSQLGKILILRMRWALRHGDKQFQILRVRTFVVLRHWLMNYYQEDVWSDRQLRLALILFVNDMSNQPSDQMSEIDRRIVKTLKRIVSKGEQRYRIAKDAGRHREDAAESSNHGCLEECSREQAGCSTSAIVPSSGGHDEASDTISACSPAHGSNEPNSDDACERPFRGHVLDAASPGNLDRTTVSAPFGSCQPVEPETPLASVQPCESSSRVASSSPQRICAAEIQDQPHPARTDGTSTQDTRQERHTSAVDSASKSGRDSVLPRPVDDLGVHEGSSTVIRQDEHRFDSTKYSETHDGDQSLIGGVPHLPAGRPEHVTAQCTDVQAMLSADQATTNAPASRTTFNTPSESITEEQSDGRNATSNEQLPADRSSDRVPSPIRPAPANAQPRLPLEPSTLSPKPAMLPDAASQSQQGGSISLPEQSGCLPYGHKKSGLVIDTSRRTSASSDNHDAGYQEELTLPTSCGEAMEWTELEQLGKGAFGTVVFGTNHRGQTDRRETSKYSARRDISSWNGGGTETTSA